MPKKAKSPVATKKAAKAIMAALSTPETLRVGLVQMRCVSSPAANMKTAVRMIREAAAKGLSLIHI